MWNTLPQHLRLCEHRILSSKSRIKTSHERCRSAGLDSELSMLFDILPDTDLVRLLGEQLVLVEHAREIFMEVHQQLLDRSALFLLTDRHLRVLEIFSAPEVIRSCAIVGIRPGASLAESSCGTNAVAMAARHREPSIVKGEQHYCRVFCDWMCVAVPIADNHGELSGCINLSLNVTSELGCGLALTSLLAYRLGGIMCPEQSHESGARVPQVSRMTADWRKKPISTTQMSILAALRQGMTYKQISAQLGMSTRTVESHVEKLRGKFGAKTTVHLIALIAQELPSVTRGDTDQSHTRSR